MASAIALAGSSTISASNCHKSSCTRHFLQGFAIKGLQASRRSHLPPLFAKLSATRGDPFVTSANLLAGALFASMASSGSAFAAQQALQLVDAADEDNRGLAILLPLIPAVAWVLYNILQPALNQLNRMRSAKGLAIGLGIGAALSGFAMTPHDALAVEEIAQIADNDNRGLILLGVLVPAIGWVLYNILQPALNQINRMRSAKAIAGGVGIGGATLALLSAPEADASVQEFVSIAASESNNDSRGLLLLIVLLPAVGWVLFNILQPALNQLNRMRSQKK